jgi:hypothetical protein
MAISLEKALLAQAEAKKYLEYSSYSLCLMLGITPENAEEEIDSGVMNMTEYGYDTNHVTQLQSAVGCLKKQMKILESLGE